MVLQVQVGPEIRVDQMVREIRYLPLDLEVRDSQMVLGIRWDRAVRLVLVVRLDRKVQDHPRDQMNRSIRDLQLGLAVQYSLLDLLINQSIN